MLSRARLLLDPVCEAAFSAEVPGSADCGVGALGRALAPEAALHAALSGQARRPTPPPAWDSGPCPAAVYSDEETEAGGYRVSPELLSSGADVSEPGVTVQVSSSPLGACAWLETRPGVPSRGLSSLCTPEGPIALE